jgi:DNA-binding PadR family transcriptional regulator
MEAKPRKTIARASSRPAGTKEAVSRWVSPPEVNWPNKPPRIDIKFPILGFLMESEMTGYDLKRRFRDPVGFFYRASDGSLYPALKKLEHEGMVTMRAEQRGQRARKVYAITAKGRERFLRTLREPAQPIFVYDEAQVKIYFAQHEPETAVHHVERERRFSASLKSFLERLLEDMRGRGASPFRTSMVEVGHGIASLKVELFDRLLARLAQELRVAPAKTRASAAAVRRRARPRSRSDR